MISWRHTISIQCLLLGLISITSLRAQQKTTTTTAADVQGSTLFDSNCGSCHGSDGRGGEHGPDIATDPDLQRLTDSDLIGIAKNGVPGTGMPAFGGLGQEKLISIVQYLRTLQGRQGDIKLSGDPKAGEALFLAKRDAQNAIWPMGEAALLAVTFRSTEPMKAPARSKA